MYCWVKLIIAIKPKLEMLIGILDKRVNDEALKILPPTETQAQLEQIIKYCDLKDKLLNLSVMHNYILTDLQKFEKEILIKNIQLKTTYEELGEYYNLNKSTIMRKADAAMIKCAKALKKAGYTASRLDKEYKDVYIVKKMLTKISVKT